MQPAGTGRRNAGGGRDARLDKSRWEWAKTRRHGHVASKHKLGADCNLNRMTTTPGTQRGPHPRARRKGAFAPLRLKMLRAAKTFYFAEGDCPDAGADAFEVGTREGGEAGPGRVAAKPGPCGAWRPPEQRDAFASHLVNH